LFRDFPGHDLRVTIVSSLCSECSTAPRSGLADGVVAHKWAVAFYGVIATRKARFLFERGAAAYSKAKSPAQGIHAGPWARARCEIGAPMLSSRLLKKSAGKALVFSFAA
jgi:hypothetical protein